MTFTHEGASETIEATDVLVAAGPWTPRLLPAVSLLTPCGHSVIAKPTRPLSPYILFPNINPAPNQFTGGQGPMTGAEVQFNIHFSTPFSLAAGDHVFFRPEVDFGNAADFLWLSAPKPMSPPLFVGDLQSWTRNDGIGALAPDWSRIGTDITHQGPFNATFSLTGATGATPFFFSTGQVVSRRAMAPVTIGAAIEVPVQ